MMRRDGAAVFALCAVPRLLWLAFAPQPFESDYVRVADAIAAGTTGTLSSWHAALEPGYPLFLAAFPAAAGRQVAQIAFVSAGGACLFALTARLTASRRAAVAAAVLFACYPYFVWQSAVFNGAAFTAALLAMALLALDRSERAAGTVLAGAVFGALAVTRVSFAPLIACGAFVLARRTGWPLAAAFAGAALLVIAPWLAVTWQRDGGLVPPRAGLNLYLSACEFGRWIPDYDLDVLIPPTLERLQPRVAGLTPGRAARAADRLLAGEAVSCAAADPLRFTGGVLRRAALTFSPRLMPVHPRGPDSEAVRAGGRLELRAMPERARWAEWVHGIATLVLLFAAMAGMLSRHVARSAMLYLTIGVLTLTNGLFMVSTRLASSTSLVLMIFAGAAFARRR